MLKFIILFSLILNLYDIFKTQDIYTLKLVCGIFIFGFHFYWYITTNKFNKNL